jgi:DNA-binding MarR family transcriptional regulator
MTMKTGSSDSMTRRLGIRIGFLIHDVSRLRRVFFDLRRLNLDITRSEAWVLTGISRRRGGISQTELAKVLGLGKVATGEFLSDLEGKRLIVRRPDANDRRANSVQLTARGKTMLASISAVVAKMNAEIFAGYSGAEMQRLADQLTKTKRRLLDLVELNDSDPRRSMRAVRPRATRVAPAQRTNGKLRRVSASGHKGQRSARLPPEDSVYSHPD